MKRIDREVVAQILLWSGFALFALALTDRAHAATTYDVTATMPVTTGSPLGCKLYLNGTNVGGTKPCGSPQLYAGLITADGTYTFTYSLAITSSTETAKSPATTVTITTSVTPPTQPPTISVACNPAPCPANIVITISP